MIPFMLLLMMAQEDRISSVYSAHPVAVPGNVHAYARQQFDQGAVDPAMKLNYVTLVLKSSASQQADLEQLLHEQQDSSSPNFRKWLTPEEYADRFGTSPADMAKIASWLKSEGFEIVS